MSQNFTTRIVA